MDPERQHFFDDNIPPSVITKIRPYLEDVGEIMRWQEDFPHRKFHVVDMLGQLQYVKKTLGLDPITTDLAERAIRLHDVGHRFVEQGILTYRQHHFGSLAVSVYVDGDPRVWDAVYYHSANVLPPESPLLRRVVRDLDRITGMGYIGFARLSKYYGLKDSIFEEKDEQAVAESGIFIDTQPPTSLHYEDKAKEFFNKRTVPFFVKRGAGDLNLELLKLQGEIMLDRFNGRDYTHLGRKLSIHETEKLSLDNGAFVVEPVMSELRNLYRMKQKNTYEAVFYMDGAESVSFNRVRF
jgi:hypothetical protein